ncbi:HNH endonuclease [Stenotrophomonas maltophilia]|nr:HNH endonuclease [Stenotrophomonas maltophilia]
MTTADVDAFAHRVRAFHAARGPATPRWALDVARRSENPACAFCTAPLDLDRRHAWGLSPLVPLSQGGPTDTENLRMACKRCITERGSRDLLAWPELSQRLPPDTLEALLADRLLVLQRSDNHLVEVGRFAKPATVLAQLQERWIHPRFLVHVERHSDSWMLGWPLAQRAHLTRNDLAALLRNVHQGEWLEHPEVVAFRLTADVFQLAVWQLIALHALVVPLPIETYPLPDRTFENRWMARYPSLRQIQLRRQGTHEAPWPSQAKDHVPAYSDRPNAVRMRTQRQATREGETKAQWLEARRRLAKRDAGVASGTLRAWLPGERAAMQADVDDLAQQWLSARRLFTGTLKESPAALIGSCSINGLIDQ